MCGSVKLNARPVEQLKRSVFETCTFQFGVENLRILVVKFGGLEDV